MAKLEDLKIGQRVRAPHGIYEAADDHSPGGWWAKAGDELIIRHIGNLKYEYPITVSHDRQDAYNFCVKPDELELIGTQTK